MIVEPEKWISQVRDLGADIMNIHQKLVPISTAPYAISVRQG